MLSIASLPPPSVCNCSDSTHFPHLPPFPSPTPLPTPFTHPPPPETESTDDYTLTSRALHAAGVRLMLGVVGIPATTLAPAAQTAGIRFISFHNEQAAGYAFAAVGYLTERRSVGALLSVSGPGLVRALAGNAGADAKGWPLVALAGSCDPALVGRGPFPELGQAAAAAALAEAVVKVDAVGGLASAVKNAVSTAMEGTPGGVHLDLPTTTVFHYKVEVAVGGVGPYAPPPPPPSAADGDDSYDYSKGDGNGDGNGDGGAPRRVPVEAAVAGVAAAAAELAAAARLLPMVGKRRCAGRRRGPPPRPRGRHAAAGCADAHDQRHHPQTATPLRQSRHGPLRSAGRTWRSSAARATQLGAPPR